jgi:hypothetical protein
MRYITTLCVYIALACCVQAQVTQTPKTIIKVTPKACSEGDLATCFEGADERTPSCSKFDPSDTEGKLACQRKTQCIQDRASILDLYDANCKGVPEGDAKCDAQKKRLDTTLQCDQNPHPNPYRIAWKFVTSQQQYPPIPRMLHAGDNREPNLPEYLCKSPLVVRGVNVGMHFGKILNDRCNLAYDGGTIDADYFWVAYFPEMQGYWAESGDESVRLSAWVVQNGSNPAIACRARYATDMTGLSAALSALTAGDKVDEHGTQLGEYRGGSCHFEYGSQEVTSASPSEFFYLAQLPAAIAPAHSPSPSCGVAGKPACRQKAVCPPQTIYCGLLAQPDNYPGQTITCAAGLHGSCQTFSCSSDAYTRPMPICK